MNIVMHRIEWEDFIKRLNNPTLENLEARNRFFKKCDELVVSRNGESVSVECPNLNTEAILAALNK